MTAKKKSTPKKTVIEEVEAPDISTDPLFQEMLKTIHDFITGNICQVRDFEYKNEWFNCSEDVKNIINIKNERNLNLTIDNIEKDREIEYWKKLYWFSAGLGVIVGMLLTLGFVSL